MARNNIIPLSYAVTDWQCDVVNTFLEVITERQQQLCQGITAEAARDHPSWLLISDYAEQGKRMDRLRHDTRHIFDVER